MKKLIKCLIIFCVVINVITPAYSSGISKLTESSNLSKQATIAVSVKDVKSGKVIYQSNENKLLHPASTLKVFTTFPAISVVKDGKSFKTDFYIYDNCLFIKLSGDPLLSSLNLKQAVKSIKNQGYSSFNNVYFDTTAMDNMEWGIGWMWDDGTNPLMQKVSIFNLDDNLTTISASKDENGVITVNSSNSYKIPVLNDLKSGNSNDVTAVRQEWISPDIVCLKGTLASAASVKVPINNMRKYFENRLSYYLSQSKINIVNKTYMIAKVPDNAKKIATVVHPAMSLIGGILKSSDNKNAETLAKFAGGIKYNTQATLSSQIKLFYDYWKNQNVNTEGLFIADASGVSRNNLITVDFMTNALNKLYETEGAEFMKSALAQPGEGTLSNRLLNYRGNLFLKTGTLSNISGLTGYVISEHGKVYSVAILIENFSYPQVQVKSFENKIIEEIIKL